MINVCVHCKCNVLLNCVCAVADLGVFAEIIYTGIENDDINTYKSSIYFTDDQH